MSYSRLTFLFFFALVMTAFTGRAEADEWKLFYQVEEGPKFYFDKESVVSPQKGIIRVWMKTALAEDESEEIEQSRTDVEIDCKGRSYKVVEQEKSDGGGPAIKGNEAPPDRTARRLPLDSAMGSLWTNLCPDK